MTDNEQHVRDLQREYLDFLDDEVRMRVNGDEINLNLKITFCDCRRIKAFTQIKSKR